jgi:SAM-dependent methyltransferase
MKDNLKKRILEIDNWRHPYILGEGLINKLSIPWWEDWHKWRLNVDLNNLEVILNGIEGKRVLDLGCNDGFYGFEYAKRGAKKVIGIDARQEEAIDRANLIKDYFEIKNISFECRDISRINYCENFPKGFDLVLMYGLLYHLSDPIETLHRIGKITKRVIAIQTFLSGSKGPILYLRGEDTSKVSSGVTPITCNPSQSTIVKMLHHAGFSLVLRVCPFPHLIGLNKNQSKNYHFGFFYGIKVDEDQKIKLLKSLEVSQFYNPKRKKTQIVEINESTLPLIPYPFVSNVKDFFMLICPPIMLQVLRKIKKSSK